MKIKIQNTIQTFLLTATVIGMGGFFFPAHQVFGATGVNKQINFQGKVVNTDGTNVGNASYNFLFCVYTTASPATPCTAGANNDAVWKESKSITTTDGIFQTNLGDTTAFASLIDFNTDNIYLGINFNSNGQMTPLVHFTATPYALSADKVHGLSVTDTTGTLTIPAGKTIQFADAFSTAGAFATVLTSTGVTNVTLPTTGTLATLAGTETLTNKTIGSTGLVFSGATTDIASATAEDLTLQAGTTSETKTVQIGAGGAGSLTPDFLALDVKSTTGDPVATGFEGAMYYNTVDNKFRCYQNTAWTDCIGAGTGGGTLQTAYDTVLGNTIVTTTGRNIAYTLDEVATPTSFTVENKDTTGVSAERIWSSIASGTLTNGLLVEQTGAGTMTNAIQIAETTGTITDGILITGILGNILNSASIDITGSGAIIGATGVSTTTVTASGAIAANGGITFDSGTDTISAFTASGTISMGVQALNGTTGVINYTGFDVDASGNLDALGTLTAGSGNIQVTDATGKVQHDSIVDCADGQILKWATAGGWACGTDQTGGGGGLSTRSFSDTTVDTVVDRNTTSYWDTAAENNNSFPNITPSTTSKSIYGVVTMETLGKSTGDAETTARVEANIGSSANCNSGTSVGGSPGTFSSNNRVTKTSTTTFLYSPATTSTIYINICSDTATVGTTATITRLRVTLFEVDNSNADLAEIYPTNDETLLPGEVVSIDRTMINGIKRSAGAHDRDVLGIISSQPALVIGGKGDEGVTGFAVALSGRIPVQVSTENGRVVAGDYLTSSSVPGVAMKATKAGVIIGQALQDFNYSDDEVGLVMTFVKNTFFNGVQLTDSSGLMTGKSILQRLVSDKIETEERADMSAIVTDQVVAGFEIITPKVMTQELAVDTIKPSLTNMLAVQLGPDGEITFGEPGKEPTSHIDALGNATFSGVVTAKTIRAETIEGLEIYTDSVKSLAEKYASLTASGIVSQAVPERAVSSGETASTALAQALKSITVDTLTVTLDSTILGQLSATGGLTISGPAEFKGESIFRKLATFFGKVVFRDRVAFEKAPVFASDTAGFAIIEKGARKVRVTFDTTYEQQPIVTATLSNDQSPLLDGTEDATLVADVAAVEQEYLDTVFASDVRYLVTEKGTDGFTIVLSKDVPYDLHFSWVALAVKGSKTFISEKVKVTTPEVTKETIDITSTDTSVIDMVVPIITTENVLSSETQTTDTITTHAVDETETITSDAGTNAEVAPVTDVLSTDFPNV
ncbi:MAG: hypothetical protein COZ86_02355 [Candidatus Moranbacteria bacterium CG_4_8_14_3_um_filter_41_13]|nr:MAG: hypothetical protein AUK58_00805 [Candidatus Moranbacteria bacterium CG2_30_41_165]PIW94190.1 MAG: hypothetical protein COZ86_02355 [Candidatus Moranbacteria bacterium CG_4_8_14_3_um_filter_41_13]